tara:strand:- start:7038 stop:8615 length:1578 start_codon:yes stop_codon:yes gene_type:complete
MRFVIKSVNCKEVILDYLLILNHRITEISEVYFYSNHTYFIMEKKAFIVQDTESKSQEQSLRGGFAVQGQNGFSTIYRLIDISLVVFLYYCSFYLFNLSVSTNDLLLVAIFIVSFQLIAEAMDLYRSWRGFRTTEVLKNTAYCWTITSTFTLTLGFFLVDANTQPQLVILTWFASSLGALLSWRYVMRKFLFKIRRSGMNSRKSIVIGATKIGYNLAHQIIDNEQLGIHFNGIFDDRAEDRLAHKFKNQVLGSIEDAIQLAKSNQVDYIYIALPMSAEKRIRFILEKCSDTTANVYIVPNFFIYNLMNARWQSIGSVQALSVYDTPFQGANDLLKRVEDIVLGSVILLMLTIPMLVIALAVKLTSPGPIIFKQKRYGLDGKQILVYKFRSMKVQDNGPVVKQATKNDPRITKLGAFLRKTSLDELPQFINVIQGRMSIVGPRPHAVAHNEEYRKLIKGYMLRHKVRPGITGWAQVNGFRGETDTIDKMVKRVEYDLEYIHRWSVWLDIKIVFMTIFKGFTNKNAY